MARYKLVSIPSGAALGLLELPDAIRPVLPAGVRCELIETSDAPDAVWSWDADMHADPAYPFAALPEDAVAEAVPAPLAVSETPAPVTVAPPAPPPPAAS